MPRLPRTREMCQLGLWLDSWYGRLPVGIDFRPMVAMGPAANARKCMSSSDIRAPWPWSAQEGRCQARMRLLEECVRRK